MTKWTVERDGQRDLRFEGEQLGAVSDRDNNDRWTEMELYKTASGKFVLAIAGCSRFQGEDTRSAHVCDDETEVVDTLIDDSEGELSWLAKKLLERAGIDAAEEI